jgi:protease I
MKRAVIILEAGTEDTEFAYPYYRLQEAGFTVDVATKGRRNTNGKWGLPISATVDSEQIKASEYDLAVVPGGYESPDRVRQIANVRIFLRDFDTAGKIISSVCHGPWVLISAGIVRGRQMTCYPGCKDDLINAGAKYVEAPAVTDRNIVTSPHFRHNHDWLRATLEAYAEVSRVLRTSGNGTRFETGVTAVG